MVDTAPYEVLESKEVLEIRGYPKLLLATISGGDESTEFGHLFRYIAGDNKARQRIAMTAPVFSDAESMSFVMPRKYSLAAAPEPLDQNVRLQEVPARKVAVVCFKGRAGERSVEEEKALLFSELKKHGLTSIGEPFLMRYNSPWTPGFLRHNEVGIEIQ